MQPAPTEEAAPEQPVPEEVGVPLLVFRVGVVWYAVAAQRVKSIVGATITVRIPGTPAFIAGVANVSGRIAVVLELGQLLGRTEHAADVSERLLLFDSGTSVVGVLTDEVAGVASIATSRLLPLGGDDMDAVIQTFTDADRHVTVVDVDRMISLADREVRQRGEASTP